jgi:hypothetical protein
MLAPLAYNGGRTPTMALLPASPAIDAADDSVCPQTDQRGVPRPKGLASDIGAFELSPSLTLSAAGLGRVRIDYSFKAGQTNSVSTSTDLLNWVLLGTRVSDPNGVFEIEEVDREQFPNRFYRIQLAR